MNVFLVCFISGSSFLLSFLLFFHPLQENEKANRWLGFSVFIMGCAFMGSYLTITGTTISNNILFKSLSSSQFLLAPCFYMSILYFVNPAKVFRKRDWLHFLPFIIYATAEMFWDYEKGSISTCPFFKINNEFSLKIRDILPFLALFYVIKSYLILVKHKKNLKLISSDINQISLDWLVQFLFILSITIFIWFNDALFGLPFLTEATNFIYSIAVFFLAYFSIKQKAIFAFKEKDIKEISELIENENHKTEVNTLSEIVEVANVNETPKEGLEAVKEKLKRLSTEQVANLSNQLSSLMDNDKLFLDNDLNLPTVAEKLGISIHEASFLINETTKDNFYNFINKYRVDEAKRLLASSKMEELNILGIAFASGFNSKTTFNTTFKRVVGISPSQYSKEQKK
jgi:AraC-like DNA-binding protein